MSCRALPFPLAALVTLATACGEPTSVPIADASRVPSAVSAARGGWVHNVSGGGEDLYPGSIAPDFSISFTAKEDANGRDVGSVTWSAASTGALISAGDVRCLLVDGNRAYIWYEVTAGNPNDWSGPYGTVGNNVILGFEDNGEGANAPRDRHTFIYYTGPGLATSCEAVAAFLSGPGGGFPVEWTHGNVQVR